MRNRCTLVALRTIVIVIAVFFISLPSFAQSAPASPRPPVQNPGRYQLVPQDQGTMFLVDTASGRVWRYTRVEPSESEVKAYVDTLVGIQETSSGRTFSETERKSLYDKLAKDRREELQQINNPCKGLVTCFVEVDRVRLTQSGWVSEVVGEK